MYEGECMECGNMYEGSEMCESCGGEMREGEMCESCGNTYEGNIQELGGMDDGHPRLGKKRLPTKMSIEDIENLLRGDANADDDANMYGDDDDVEIDDFDKLEEEEVCEECGDTYETELEEKLYGNQSKIDKNKNGRIDREDFKILRREESEVYELELNNEETFLFTENEIIDIIENIVLEEKKKSKAPSAQNILKSTLGQSKKENDDNIKDVVKKMKEYLKDMSKGEFEMNPKHFPAGNGELEEMEKMAYKASNAVEEYVENFTAAALENIDYDEIHPNEEWVTDNIVGSSRTGNNPDWANAVETPNNKKRNEIRKDNLLSKLKKKAYNKAPQPISNDTAGNKVDKASKIMLNLESKESEQVISEITRMKNILTYTQKTQ
jgi:hypothetical protein